MARGDGQRFQFAAIGWLIALAHLAVGLLLAVAVSLASERGITLGSATQSGAVVFYTWFGVVFSEASCLSFWLAFGVGRVWMRLATVASAAWALWTIHFVVVAGRVMPAYSSVGPGVALALQILLLQAPFLFWRYQGWSFRSDAERSATPQIKLQYGVRHLLVLTTLVGVLSPIARSFQETREASSFLVFVCVNCLFSSAVVLVALRSDRPWAGLATVSGWVVLTTVIEIWGIRWLTGTPTRNDLSVRLAIANLVQVACLILTAIPLRRFGFRLRTSSGT